jgi:hypothetical protein
MVLSDAAKPCNIVLSGLVSSEIRFMGHDAAIQCHGISYEIKRRHVMYVTNLSTSFLICPEPLLIYLEVILICPSVSLIVPELSIICG